MATNPMQAALAEMRQRAARIAEIRATLAQHEEQRKAMRAQRVSLHDYQEFLKQKIARVGGVQEIKPVLATAISSHPFNGAPSGDANFSWADHEHRAAAGYSELMAVLQRLSPLQLMAFVFPQELQGAILTLVEREFGTRFARDVQPLSERREAIAAMDSEDAALRDELDGLEAENKAVTDAVAGLNG